MKKHLFFLFCLLVFVFLLGVHIGTQLLPLKKQTLGEITETKTSVVSVTKHITCRDTIFVDRPKYYKSVVKDTVFLKTEDGRLIVSQKEYRDSNYVAWVSGIEPQLDSIMVFNNTEYIFKTSTIETVKAIEDKTGKWFTGAGLYRLDNTLVPKLNVVYQKKRIMFGASVGLYNNQPIYGVDINFKIK